MDEEKKLDLENSDLDIDGILHVLNSWDLDRIPSENEEKDCSKTYVRISPDGMEAWLFLVPPLKGEIYTKEVLLSLLEGKGVKAGYLHSSLHAMINKKVYCRETKVAKGLPAVAGKDGYYQFFFAESESQDSLSESVQRADGTHERLSQNVEKDDVLAIYHPAEQGTAGYDVRGKFLPLRPGKELRQLQGKGFYRSEGSNTYFASVTGKVEYTNGNLEIQNIRVIEGNVTSMDGKIEFFGDIIIEGNVDSGVVIRTAKTLTIYGNVHACTLYAGGDLILKKGVKGANQAKIVSKGNLYADYIEYANVEVQKDVIANSITNSIVNAQGKIKVTGTKGALVGGYAHAVEAIEVISMGSAAEIRTIAHVGCKPDIMDKRKALLQMEKYLKEEMIELAIQMKEMDKEKVEDREIFAMESKIQSLLLHKKDMIARLEKLKEDSESVNCIVKKAAKAYIKVDGPIYRGVTVCADDLQLTIQQKTSFMKYTNSEGELTPKVLID